MSGALCDRGRYVDAAPNAGPSDSAHSLPRRCCSREIRRTTGANITTAAARPRAIARDSPRPSARERPLPIQTIVDAQRHEAAGSPLACHPVDVACAASIGTDARDRAGATIPASAEPPPPTIETRPPVVRISPGVATTYSSCAPRGSMPRLYICYIRASCVELRGAPRLAVAPSAWHSTRLDLT